MDWEGENIKIGFQLMSSDLLSIISELMETGLICPSTLGVEERPVLSLRPYISSAEFNFQQDIEWLPFKLNIQKKDKLTCDQQDS